MQLNTIYNENCLDTMARIEDNSIDCIVTSPPYNKKSSNRKPHKSDTWSNGKSAIKYSHFSDDMPEEEREKWNDAWEENSEEGVELLGWVLDENEYWIYGPIELSSLENKE